MEGIQQALVEVLLLANCPVLIGTYYSSYSETAKLMGWPYYIQVSSICALPGVLHSAGLQQHFSWPYLGSQSRSFNSILAIHQALAEHSCAWDLDVLIIRPDSSGFSETDSKASLPMTPSEPDICRLHSVSMFPALLLDLNVHRTRLCRAGTDLAGQNVGAWPFSLHCLNVAEGFTHRVCCSQETDAKERCCPIDWQ